MKKFDKLIQKIADYDYLDFSNEELDTLIESQKLLNKMHLALKFAQDTCKLEHPVVKALSPIDDAIKSFEEWK